MSILPPENVSLEVAHYGNPDAPRQLCANPNGERGGFWWTTPLPNATIAGVDARVWGFPHALSYAAASEGPALWRSVMFPCDRSRGQNPYAYLTRLLAAAPITATFVGYDAAGNSTGTTNAVTIPQGVGTQNVTIAPGGALPAATRQVRLSLTWTASAGGTQAILTDFKVTAATSLPARGAIVEAGWVDLGADASEITCTSAGLEPGSLTAALHTPWADPAILGLFAPGSPIRFSVSGRRLFTGTVSTAITEYRKSRRSGVPLKPTITVNAVDAIAQLAAAPSPRGVTSGYTYGAQFVVENAGVPWNINDSTAHHGEPPGTYPNPGASALDQVILWRDTPGPSPVRAWVGSDGVLYMSSAVEGAVLTFTDEPGSDWSYTDVDAGFDPTDCVNTVTLHVSDGSTTRTVGPDVDPVSVQRWGQRPAEWCVYGTPATYNGAEPAARILASNATPTARVRSIGFDVTANRQQLAAMLRPTLPIMVRHNGRTHTCRIDTITHTVSARPDVKRPAVWRTSLALAPANTRPLPLQATFPK